MDTSPLNEPWQRYDGVFDEHFWPEVVQRLWQDAAGDVMRLRHHLLIVPDASMYVPFQRAWQDYARMHQVVCVMPRLMTLLDWAKAQGASDWDGQHTERSIEWMAQLNSAPEFTKWLSGSDDADVFSMAQAMVDLSDELSLHFFSGQHMAADEQALQHAVDTVYDAQAGILAQQELSMLLQCWRADVQQQTPVVRYLSVLANMVNQPPALEVTVLRNREWSPHESWFWRAYGHKAKVTLLYVAQTRSLIDVHVMTKAWGVAASHVLNDQNKPDAAPERHVYAAPHLEDEAQLIVQQVLLWRAQGLKKIALVALDRTVGRRVWALLRRCGVLIRDDTGWLLSTARGASSWQHGFQLWVNEVTFDELIDWFSHPFVMADVSADRKMFLVRYFKELSYKSRGVVRTWRDWLSLAQRYEPSPQIQTLVDDHHWVIQILQMGVAYERQFMGKKTMPQWVDVVRAWGREFGMENAWQSDPSGQVWLRLLESWRGVVSTVELSFAEFLRVVQSAVEQATFRVQDVGDEVLLLPLGSTRMRDFDAVWLMGADGHNLPNMQQDTGLLNVSTRLTLGMNTFMDAQAQTLRDLIDLWARTPLLMASFCVKKDGSPNGLSTWLTQWLRASGSAVEQIDLAANQIEPDVAYRQQVQVSDCVPHVLSATDLAVLVQCPYQFYARKILKLKTLDAPTDDVLPAEKGNLWHGLVVDFHVRRKQHETTTREQDVADFNGCIESVLQPLAKKNARYWAVRERLLSYVSAYVDWWRDRELAGWRVSSHEQWHEQAHPIQVESSAILPLQWQGKIDQVDVRDYFDEQNHQHTQEFALIDYKTGDLAHYQKEIINGADVQLAFYLNLLKTESAHQVVQAGYIGVSDEPIRKRKAEKPHQGDTHYPQVWLNQSQALHDAQPLIQSAQVLQQQVNQRFKEMVQGAPLAALGELAACQYCAVRGLCRKGHTFENKEVL